MLWILLALMPGTVPVVATVTGVVGAHSVSSGTPIIRMLTGSAERREQARGVPTDGALSTRGKKVPIDEENRKIAGCGRAGIQCLCTVRTVKR